MKPLTYKQIKTDAILDLTFRIQIEFPGLYEHLSESPVFTSLNQGSVTQNELNLYFDSLKAQADKFAITRRLV